MAIAGHSALCHDRFLNRLSGRSNWVDVVVEADRLHAVVAGEHLFVEVAQDFLHFAHRRYSLHLEGDLADVHVLHPGHKGRYGA